MYIEREETCECGCECCNPDTPVEPECDKDYEDNLKRWQWLIDGWDKMSFKERFSLFTPYLHYINLRDHFKPAFDDQLNEEVTTLSYDLCRSIRKIKFDPDGQGIPNILIVFDSINCDLVPNANVKRAMMNWYNTYIKTENPYI